MFENSVVSVDTLTQTMIDGYVSTANGIYTNGRSIKDKSTSVMESIYKLDDTTDLDVAKKLMDNNKIAWDKLVLSKSNRVASNQADRV
jgi:hypothetical protein